MGLTLAIDFGSTFTKVVAVDLDKEELVGVAQAPSTVDKDMTIALHSALEKLRVNIGVNKLDKDLVLACSSAAGGLRVVAAGLVRVLTTKAAEEAALGAGAKIVGTFSYGLSPGEVKRIEQVAPDLTLLTGGIDGGNEEVIIHNAAALASSQLNSPVVIAGNKMATPKAKLLLEAANKYVIAVENALPELDKLNVEPARAAVRDIFMRRIIHAKGLDKAQAFVNDIIMPTPMAVLKGASLLAEGAEGENGVGELIVVDVGGATTDVHSIAHGYPSREGIIVKGLPPPYRKRTVEGDLGIRYNAQSILEISDKAIITEKLASLNRALSESINLEAAVRYLSGNVGAVSQSEEDFLIDLCLAHMAVNIATERHAAKIEILYFPPAGKAEVQYGKDLTKVKCVIGTGGIFAYGQDPSFILKAACYDTSNPNSLRPTAPEFFVDKRYILYAVGLLSEVCPAKALRIMKKHLKKL